MPGRYLHPHGLSCTNGKEPPISLKNTWLKNCGSLAWNSYAMAWPEALPFNATLLKGLTFVSYNHYNYDNIWHGLSATVPFVAWHIRNGCESPSRWILYHWGPKRRNSVKKMYASTAKLLCNAGLAETH
uniref:Uncharacterized protein n=1 Tax=Salix viminalis TaxID=40686 RepID=A0A6N2LK51_SALVM